MCVMKHLYFFGNVDYEPLIQRWMIIVICENHVDILLNKMVFMLGFYEWNFNHDE